MSSDPEITALTSQIKAVVGRAYRLSRSLDLTLKDLQTYGPLHERMAGERRASPSPWRPSSNERRHG